MSRLDLLDLAPDFELPDYTGQRTVRLSDLRGQRLVILVFNRGFL